ncbi:hypothetical protein QQL38_14490 [Pseudomonas syringae]|uniref:hypothetical protein n=1 Tax=Pseudomonas syringae TaxID=317 RepID=UPI003D806D07
MSVFPCVLGGVWILAALRALIMKIVNAQCDLSVEIQSTGLSPRRRAYQINQNNENRTSRSPHRAVVQRQQDL